MCSKRIQQEKMFLLDNLALAIAALLLDTAFSVTFPNFKQELCKLENGHHQCIEATLCKSTVIEIAFGRKPIVCGWMGQIPRVCCGENKEEETTTSGINEISPKECGIRNDPPSDVGTGIVKYPKGEGSVLEGGIQPRSFTNVEEPASFNLTENKTYGILNSSFSILTVPNFAVGGASVTIPWPWMAAIFSGNGVKQLCGGVLIDDRHILTAAHCFAGRSRNPKDYTVMVGEISLTSDFRKREVEAMKIHESYMARYYYNDIAILRLAESLEDVPPVCLPAEDHLRPGDNCTLLGWGDLAYGGASSLILQEVTGLPVVAHDECDGLYKEVSGRAFPRGITENFICAGLDAGGKDACQGDSGGPLLYKDPESGAWITVGIVSFGYGCAEAGYPGVYTKVASFTNWIEDYVNKQNELSNRNAKYEDAFVDRPVWRSTEKVIFPG